MTCGLQEQHLCFFTARAVDRWATCATAWGGDMTTWEDTHNVAELFLFTVSYVRQTFRFSVGGGGRGVGRHAAAVGPPAGQAAALLGALQGLDEPDAVLQSGERPAALAA